eukprot:5089261-Lingulodinium_polyedra.AAC.1
MTKVVLRLAPSSTRRSCCWPVHLLRLGRRRGQGSPCAGSSVGSRLSLFTTECGIPGFLSSSASAFSLESMAATPRSLSGAGPKQPGPGQRRREGATQQQRMRQPA